MKNEKVLELASPAMLAQLQIVVSQILHIQLRQLFIIS